MKKTGNDVNFCFIDFAIDESDRINTNSILTLIGKLVIPNSTSSFLSMISSQSGVFVFYFGLLITLMQLSLRLCRCQIEAIERVTLVLSSILLSSKSFFITIWRLC